VRAGAIALSVLADLFLDTDEMITRIWHGWTTADNAEAYESLLLTQVFPGITARSIPGYIGIRLDRRRVPEGVEFVTTMLFASLDAVVAFAGEDYERAVVPLEAQAVLLRYDAEVAHYEVISGIGEPMP
jgi:hypothetical protein